MISAPHYHIATGHDSVNRGKFYKCPSKRCIIAPAYSNDEFPEELTI